MSVFSNLFQGPFACLSVAAQLKFRGSFPWFWGHIGVILWQNVDEMVQIM